MTAGLKQGQHIISKKSGLVERMGREERHLGGRGIQSSLPRPRVEREEQVREISELKKALTRTRQELQRTRDINRTSSDEEGGYQREGMSRSGSLTGMGSRSGSINCLSSKPSLNRELVSKLRSMTETIKMLSTENVVLREENDGLLASRANTDGEGGGQCDEEKIRSVMETYEKQIQELGQKVVELENQVDTTRQTEGGGDTKQAEKDKYKSLARRLKEERNNYKDMVEEKRKEQDDLKEEMEKMTEIIGDLRKNCSQLQDELLNVQQDTCSASSREISVQTSPRVRRASLGDISRRNMATPKRSRSTMTAQSISRQQKINELSKPKQRGGSVPGSPAKGPKFAKPVSRPGVGRKSSEPLSSKSSSPATPRRASEGSTPSSPRTSAGPSSPRTPGSRIPGPSPSKIPTPSRIPSRLPKIDVCRSGGTRPLVREQTRSTSSSSLVIHSPTSDRMYTSTSEEEVRMEVNPGSRTEGRPGTRQSPPRSVAMEVSEDSTGEEEEVLRIVEETDIHPNNTTGRDVDELPPPDHLKADHEGVEEAEYGVEDPDDDDDVVEDEFPAPPPPEHLAKLSMEAQFRIVSETVEKACDRLLHGGGEGVAEPDTPRTTRKVESMKQRLAARRIQRTWKHFYQELEEKRADDENTFSSLPSFPTPKQEAEHNKAVSNIQASILGDETRGRGLSFLREGSFNAARTRGGIYTARPWMVTSESDSEDDDLHAVQGIVRSHSFRLGTITEGDVFSPGKVRSIRAKFNRPAPDGESDYAAEGR